MSGRDTAADRALDLMVDSRLFARLDSEQLHILHGYMSLVELQAGDALFQEGAKADHCYSVIQGRIRIEQTGEMAVPSK